MTASRDATPTFGATWTQPKLDIIERYLGIWPHMTAGSRIERSEATWNPVTGCTKVREGCRHGYAERMSRRLKTMGLAKCRHAFGVVVHPSARNHPVRWRTPRRIFVNSISDLFHDAVPVAFLESVFRVMNEASDHTLQILTKRPQQAAVLSDRVRRTVNFVATVWRVAPAQHSM